MKRALSIVILAAILLSLCACGSKHMNGISDRAYDLGLAALETADDFIAGKIDAATALDKLEYAGDLVDNCDGENDFYVSSGIDFIIFAIEDKDDGTGTMSEVEDKVEYLEGILGE